MTNSSHCAIIKKKQPKRKDNFESNCRSRNAGKSKIEN
nr:MAG TPA: hypothetical protein [Caudoviricetes sp.]